MKTYYVSKDICRDEIGLGRVVQQNFFFCYKPLFVGIYPAYWCGPVRSSLKLTNGNFTLSWCCSPYNAVMPVEKQCHIFNYSKNRRIPFRRISPGRHFLSWSNKKPAVSSPPCCAGTQECLLQSESCHFISTGIKGSPIYHFLPLGFHSEIVLYPGLRIHIFMPGNYPSLPGNCETRVIVRHFMFGPLRQSLRDADDWFWPV